MSNRETRRLLTSDIYRVSMADIDGAGIIYFASPLRWYEALLSKWLDSIGHPVSLMIRSGVAIPTVSVTVDYLRPIGMDESMELTIWAEGETGRASFGTRCEAARLPEREVCVTIRARYSWVEFGPSNEVGTRSLRSAPLPEWLLSALSGNGTGTEH